MHTENTTESTTFPIRVKSLLKRAITSSKRRGAWFALDRKEKSILSLSIRLELKFESFDLLRALTSILKKLAEQGETLHAWLQRGTKIAWAFSEFAVASGNASARSWRQDRNYVEYLGRAVSGGLRGVTAR
jgi:hypothetical protein